MTDTRLSMLWALTKQCDPELWRQISSGTSAPERLREGLEILASVVWHLELAFSLGPMPNAKAVEYRKTVIDNGELLPWGQWVMQREGLKTDVASNHLPIDYSFACVPGNSALLAIQATLIGDAAMRLGGIVDILKSVAAKPNAEVFTTGEALNDLLPKISNPDTLHVVLVVAFRDAYMHAEYVGKGRHRLRTFRDSLHHEYSLSQIYDACIGFWLQVYDACYKKGNAGT